MARKLEIEIIGDTASLERALGRAQSKTERFGSAVNRGAKVAAVGLAAIAGGALVAARTASTLEEATNKATVTFGKQASTILAWSKTTARSMGISQASALQASAGFGALFQEVGDAPPVAAKFSKAMVKAAADLGSFHDVDPKEVLDNLKSGLAGETEPLRKFNIFMDEATIRAHAYKEGIAKTGEELTVNQKILARRSFILSHLGKAENDMAETLGSAANQERVANAVREDSVATMGKGLLPAYKLLLGALTAVTTFMGKHTTAVKIATGVLAGLAVGVLAIKAGMMLYAAATTGAAAAQWLLNAAMNANPFVRIITVLILLGTALVVAWKKSETFRRIVKGAWEAVKNAALTAVSFVLTAVDKYLGAIESILHVMGKMPGPLGKPFRVMAEAVGTARGKVQDLRNTVDGLKSKKIVVQAIVQGLGTTLALLHALDRIEDVRATRGIGNNAAGTSNWRGGLSWVGERGPELLNLPRGSQVIPHNRSMAMAGGGTSPTQITLNLDGKAVASWLVDLNDKKARSNGGKGFFD